eukprot:881848-Pyramimonas_sp.AAC.1
MPVDLQLGCSAAFVEQMCVSDVPQFAAPVSFPSLRWCVLSRLPTEASRTLKACCETPPMPPP